MQVRTGRQRPVLGGSIGRMLDTQHEYTCSCGHTGWSRHQGVLYLREDTATGRIVAHAPPNQGWPRFTSTAAKLADAQPIGQVIAEASASDPLCQPGGLACSLDAFDHHLRGFGR